MHYDENNVKKIDTTLEYHVAHSNPHMLFEKMVELGFASSNSDAFEKCWNSLMKTETGTNYLYELNDFLYYCCQHFAPQIKKNGNSKRFLRHSQIFEQLFVLINTKEAFWNIQALQYR